MLAGLADSDTALAHARELLDVAQAGAGLTRAGPTRRVRLPGAALRLWHAWIGHEDPRRQRAATVLPGLVGTARVERRTRALLPRLRPGDVAVVDHVDMDRATAQALVDAGVAAVVNASPMISGRYPNLGPAGAGRRRGLVVDGVGPEGFAAIRDGRTVRLHDGVVYVGRRSRGHRPRARRGDRGAARWTRPGPGWPPSWRPSPTTAPSSCAASRTCCCTAGACPGCDPHRRPAGRGRRPRSRVRRRAGRDPAVPARAGAGADRRSARAPTRSARPATSPTSSWWTRAPRRPSCPRRRRCGRPATWSCASTGARGRAAVEQLERIGVRPLRFESAATPEDAALLLADAAEAPVIVGVGHARHPRRVPRPAAVRPGQHLPDPAQGRARDSSTRPRCRTSTPGGSGRGTSCSCCSPASWRWPPRSP